MKSELVKPMHLARKAVVYIRQSTPNQVVNNQESLRLQYSLQQRARELGWLEADIDVLIWASAAPRRRKGRASRTLSVASGSARWG